MGLLQKAVETYDAHKSRIGKYYDGEKIPLVPIGHIVTNAGIEVTIDANGKFVEARLVDKNEPKIIIPITEESAGRTSGGRAHPLCDNLDYVAAYNKKKHALYLEELSEWANSKYSHPLLPPILAYVTGGTIEEDLLCSGLIQLNDNGVLDKEKLKLLICWRVVGLDVEDEACWKSTSLFNAYTEWYQLKCGERASELCMVSGEWAMPAIQHPKGIMPINGNAKLISSNDTSGFTYRGRFTDDTQAVSVGYAASQKAHNALRWVIGNQGVLEGGRMFVCWNPQGHPTPSLPLPMMLNREEKPPVTPTAFRENLKKTLEGYRKQLLEGEDGVVIAAFDAATSGRLSVTYYNELTGSDFLQRLYYWDSTCCWWNGMYGIESPSLYEIVQFAFGTLQGEKMKADDRVAGQQIQRLIACRVDKSMFPQDIERALVEKASNLQLYGSGNRAKLLFIACAAVKKYRHDRFKEDWEMALEPEREDRSYQLGRLLAVLEKAERDSYNQNEAREPNAMRMQSAFTRRPFSVGCLVWEQVKKAYYPKLNPWLRGYYDQLIGQIMEQLSRYSERELNRPLADTYLLGYYLQKNDLYTSKKEKKTEEA